MLIKSKIREYIARRLGVPQINFTLERLAATGFKPRQIFDVGAYQGDFTKLCLKIWNNAQISCFEALDQKVLQLQQLAYHNSAIKVFPGLLGAEVREQVPFNEGETASSVLLEQIPQNFPVKYYPMRTIDSIVQEHFEGQSPDFMKIDVQGYDLEVLKGSEKSLSQMQVILIEINLLDIHQNVPLIAEVIAWLNQRNWVAYDICGLTRRPLDQALWQADLMFVPSNSPLRANKGWSA